MAVVKNTNKKENLLFPTPLSKQILAFGGFIGLALVGKDIVFKFIIEYSSLRDFGP
jgi:hypothetical protein